MTAPSILELVTDPQLLGLSVSLCQETLLRGGYGLPFPSAEHMGMWEACTGRPNPPAGPFPEVAVIAGARAGKDSRIAAPIAVYEAVFGHHERHLARGERGVIPVVAQDHRATKIAFSYIQNYLLKSPLLAGLVEDVLASEITLSNGLSLSCFPCTLKSLRGWSIPCGVMDELAFFRLEGQADSDVEVQASIRRGMVGFPTTRLVKISTPYMRSGLLYSDFTRAFGHEDPDLLVWRAPSLLMNPNLKAERLERERRLDPLRYRREYEAEFAEDLESFLPVAWVDQAVVHGRHELPPRDHMGYLAAVDVSGGGADAFTLAVVHLEDQGVVADVVKGWSRPRGSAMDLEGIVGEIATTVKRYGCHRVHGDRYAAGWVVEAFRRAGLRYELPEVRRPGDTEVSYLDKSMAYAEVEPLFAQGRVALVDHPQLLRELQVLERRPRAGGKALIDHPHGGHDDYANALCLAIALVARQRPRPWAGPVFPPSALRAGVRVEGGAVGFAARAGASDGGDGKVGPQAAWVRRAYGRW